MRLCLGHSFLGEVVRLALRRAGSEEAEDFDNWDTRPLRQRERRSSDDKSKAGLTMHESCEFRL